jgi:hypothetical protein
VVAKTQPGPGLCNIAGLPSATAVQHPARAASQRTCFRAEGFDERKRIKLLLASMCITQLHACSPERIANGGGGQADLLANSSEGVTIRIKPLGLLSQLRGQLLAGAQLDTALTQVPGDGMAVGAELASELVCGLAEAIELQRLVQFIGAQSAGHTVAGRCRGADLRRCWTFPVW